MTGLYLYATVFICAFVASMLAEWLGYKRQVSNSMSISIDVRGEVDELTAKKIAQEAMDELEKAYVKREESKDK